MNIETIVKALEAKHPGAVVNSLSRGRSNDTLWVAPGQLKAVAQTLHDDPALDFRMLADLTCVDLLAWPDRNPDKDERYVLVYILYSISHKYRFMLKVRLPEDTPKVDSVTPVWKAADWPEREIWEMFGIAFDGHPNLTYLLLYEGFEGYPMRKDYPLKGQQPVVPLRAPLPVRDEPAHQVPDFEKTFFIPLPRREITNDQLMPTSMLKPGWEKELVARFKKHQARTRPEDMVKL